MLDLAKERLVIQERNRIRAEAMLPILPVAHELRRAYELRRQVEFEQFFQNSPIRARVEEKLLTRVRRSTGNPHWLPTGVLSGGGLAFYARTRNVMARVWRLERNRLRRQAPHNPSGIE